MSVFNEEIYEKAMKAKNAEELFSLAKENDIPLTQEQAQAYFARLNPQSGELADDELDNVAGGCGELKTYTYLEGMRVVSQYDNCNFWICRCGFNAFDDQTGTCERCNLMVCCANCRYYASDKGCCSNANNR